MINLLACQSRRFQRSLSAGIWLLIMLVAGTAWLPRVAAATRSDDQAQAAAPGTVRQATDFPRYGLDFITFGDPPTIEMARSAGARLARIYLSWTVVEPINTTPVNYNLAGYDTTFRNMAAAGITAVPILSDCPAWACPDPTGPINRVPMSEFAEFADALARRYSVAPYNIHHWEFFNEPDGQGGANGDVNWGKYPELYAEMLRRAVPRMRQVDPGVTILFGGLAYDWFTTDVPTGPFRQDFFAEVMRAGAGPYFDVLPFHYYLVNVHWPTLGDKTREVREMAANAGFTGVIICNEAGLTSSPNFSTPRWGTNSEEIQARYVAQIFPQSAALGLHGNVWFGAVDFATGSAFDPFAEAGLVRRDRSLKPAYHAYRASAELIGDSQYVRQLPAAEIGAENVEAYLFAGADPRRPVSVMWTSPGARATVRLPAGDVRRLFDMYGADVNLAPDAEGRLNVSLGENPVYVEWRYPPRFTDVPRDFFLYESIEYLASRGAISGYADATFRPFNNATRGQITKIIALANGWPINTAGGPHFLDVPPTNPFYETIETAYNRGIISGYEDSTFRWGNNITRGQLSKVVTLAQEWTIDVSGGPHFVDVPANNPFYEFIETAYKHGVISGYDLPGGQREFRWGLNATRGQISKIIHLALTSPPFSAEN